MKKRKVRERYGKSTAIFYVPFREGPIYEVSRQIPIYISDPMRKGG